MKKITKWNVKLVKEDCKLYDIESNVISSPRMAGNIVETVLNINDSTVEKFGMLSLNTANKVVGIHIVNVGTQNQTVVDIKGIFQRAILNNATGIILFHNHPGGSSKASREDISITKRIVDGGKLLDMKVLDHIIVYGENKYTSMKEEGVM